MQNAQQSQVMWPAEKSISATTFNNTFQTVSTALTFNPVIMILDNQTSLDVEISFNGTTIWKTFKAGEGLVLDLRANHGAPNTYTPSIGTQIYALGAAAGTGSFRISFTA